MSLRLRIEAVDLRSFDTQRSLILGELLTIKHPSTDLLLL
jgi:hypothetical protein